MGASSAAGPKRTDAAEGPGGMCFLFGPFRLETAGRTLLRDGVRIALPSRAFDALLVLASHRGEVVDKDTLLRLVWPDAVVEENTLAQSIVALRKALF